jgi:hypothetical protein
MHKTMHVKSQASINPEKATTANNLGAFSVTDRELFSKPNQNRSSDFRNIFLFLI